MSSTFSEPTEDELDRQAEELITAAFRRFLSPRVIAVVVIYAAALLLTDVPAGKTSVFCFAIWCLLVLPLGRTFLEKAGGLWLFTALVAWLDIPIVDRAFAVISNRLMTFL